MFYLHSQSHQLISTHGFILSSIICSPTSVPIIKPSLLKSPNIHLIFLYILLKELHHSTDSCLYNWKAFFVWPTIAHACIRTRKWACKITYNLINKKNMWLQTNYNGCCNRIKMGREPYSEAKRQSV